MSKLLESAELEYQRHAFKGYAECRTCRQHYQNPTGYFVPQHWTKPEETYCVTCRKLLIN